MERTNVQCTYIGPNFGLQCYQLLTPRQLEYSTRKYGKPLCFIHQQIIDLENQARKEEK